LKRYQEKFGTTILLTSHCMKDVAALCRRVVIIANGQIHYDGSLSGIVDEFSSEKIVTLQLAREEDCQQMRDIPGLVEIRPPEVRFRVGRDDVAKTLTHWLSALLVSDVVVEDPPLEEVIANVFSQAASAQQRRMLEGVAR
ncbi:MAG TPA: ABC transporter, partial [Pirellulaceae bacterium]|nr:ABC transporter [Pirellulaceae bacterium]